MAAPPTAELEPLTDGQVSQTDEVSDDLDSDYEIQKRRVQNPNTFHWLSWIMNKSIKPVYLRSWNNKCLTFLPKQWMKYFIHFHHSLQSLSIDQLIHSFLQFYSVCFLFKKYLSGSICLNISLPVSSIFCQPPPHLPPQADMGMTYSELSVIGRLRKISKCGPFSMFCKLIHTWKDVLSPMEVSK